MAEDKLRLPPHLEVGVRIDACTADALNRGAFVVEVVAVARESWRAGSCWSWRPVTRPPLLPATRTYQPRTLTPSRSRSPSRRTRRELRRHGIQRLSPQPIRHRPRLTLRPIRPHTHRRLHRINHRPPQVTNHPRRLVKKGQAVGVTPKQVHPGSQVNGPFGAPPTGLKIFCHHPVIRTRHHQMTRPRRSLGCKPVWARAVGEEP